MTRLLWLDINCSYSHSSLALPAINAQSKNGDISWDKVSATISTNVGAVTEQIIARQPDIIACTLWLFTHDYIVKIIERVKAVDPKCTVILGGPEFLGCNERFLRVHDEVDCVFRGEGEIGFHKWLEYHDDKEAWKGIQGLCYIDKNGNYHDNGVVRVADFESLAAPETSPFFDWSKPFVQLETTRGCFNSCSFCVSGAEKPVRYIPIETARKRIANIRSHGIKEIRFLDRTFNGDITRAIELLDIFREFPDMRFHLEVHPALLPEKLRKCLTDMPAGMLHIEAGIQSLDPKVLKACGRHGDPGKAVDGLRFLCGLENMATHADLIIGLPYYTLEGIFGDIHTLAGFGAEEIQLELLKVLPGTRMREDAVQYGIIYSPTTPYEVLCSDCVTIEETQTARLLSKLLDFYYNARAWRNITQQLILHDRKFTAKFLHWLRQKEYLEQPLSIEKRGLLLYDFIRTEYPSFSELFVEEWAKAGLSLRKLQTR